MNDTTIYHNPKCGTSRNIMGAPTTAIGKLLG